MFPSQELKSLCFVFVVNFPNFCVFSGKIKTLREEASSYLTQKIISPISYTERIVESAQGWPDRRLWAEKITDPHFILISQNRLSVGSRIFLWGTGFFISIGEIKKREGIKWGNIHKVFNYKLLGREKIKNSFRYYFILILTVFLKIHFTSSCSLKWWICHEANKAKTTGPIAWINLFLVNSHLILHCFS